MVFYYIVILLSSASHRARASKMSMRYPSAQTTRLETRILPPYLGYTTA
jgi:hypothetical protein